MKNNLKRIFLFSVPALFFLIGGMLYYQYREMEHPLSRNEYRVDFVVEKRENVNNLMEELENKKIVYNSSILNWYVNRNYGHVEIKAGQYSFSNNISLGEFINYLKNGIRDDRPVDITIPEGYDIEQIAQELDKKGIIKKAEFIASCKKYKYPSFVQYNPEKRYVLEGYLFPDTYKFLKGSSGEYIIDTMLNRFQKIVSELEHKYNKNFTKEDLNKIVTMASIVEKEVKKPDERGKAASVFYNRLNKKMKLQSCATVLYAMNTHKDKLYYKDLQVKSLYNTYLVNGLPVGPISNPGKGCIEAAISPDNTKYLYFVSENNGTHFFTEDAKEFLRVKQVTQGN